MGKNTESSTHISPLKDANAAFEAFTAAATTDVRLKDLFETFMENSPALAWIAAVDCTLHYMNRRYRETFDLTSDCLHQTPCFFPPEYLKLYQANNQKVVQERRMLESVEDGYDQHGRYRTFKVFKFPIYTKKGETLIGGWMIDLTSVLVTEKALKRSNDRYFFASKATSDVIWEWDIVAQELFLSEAYQELFGYKYPVNLEGLLAHVHTDDLPIVRQNIKEAREKRALYWQVEYRYHCANGAIKNILNKAFFVRDENGVAKKAIGVLQDITSHRTLQAQLAKEQQEKERKTIEAMIQGQEKERSKIGKELHDNVNQLLATAKLLLETARIDSDCRDLCLKTGGETIEKALEEIRNLSHALVTPSLEGINFQESIQQLVDAIIVTGKIQVALNLPTNVALEKIDSFTRLTLYRIVQEQLTNIIKYASANNITIALQVEQEINLLIMDDGKGFDLRKRRKGIGLKNITSRVEMHSGNIQIVSAPEKGCRISIRIPLHK